MKDKYDVIVIGAGIGGLTCGAFLAKEGKSVLVIEQHSRPGGCCASFQRKGFTFDAGCEYLTGAEKGGILYNVLEELGLKDEIKFRDVSPLNRFIGNNYNIAPKSLETLIGELKSRYPGDSERIEAFVQDCRAVNSETFALMGFCPDALNFTGKMNLAVKFMLQSPHMRKYSAKSYRQILVENFKEPEVRAILGSIIDWDTGWAANWPMLLLGCRAFQYPVGGMQALADLLARGVTRYSGELAFKTPATRILIERGRATGVELSDGRKIAACNVVSNADGRQTFMKLIGEQYLSPRLIKEYKETRLTDPVFLVSLGLDIDLKTTGFDGTTVVYNRSNNLEDIWGSDPEKCSLWILTHSLRDPSQAPQGMTTLQIMTLLPYQYQGYWKREADGSRGKEYAAMKEALADKLISACESIIPQLSQHIVCKDVATPLTFERYTLNSEGASHGWFPAPGAGMRSQKTPIKNLYQAGHWTFPGCGVSTVALSGKNASQLVIKNMR
jgi:all-trans-retinol 13,14-reductase